MQSRAFITQFSIITYCYNAVHFLPNPHKSHPIAHLWRRGMGVLCEFNSLWWRHNGRDGVSNHQPHDCLLHRLFRLRSKKTSKLHVTGLCAGNSPGTGEFPAQMASYAENVSIWWRTSSCSDEVLSQPLQRCNQYHVIVDHSTVFYTPLQ